MTTASSRRVAAIDCGTNSLRLLIADADARRGELTDVLRRMEIVRLGEGVDATGRLSPAALARTFRVLAEYVAAIRAAGAGAVRMVATSALRDAVNAGEFTTGVTGILGASPMIISGQQEAYLSFTGATAELSRPPAVLSGPPAGLNGPPAGAPDGRAGAASPRTPATVRYPPPYLVVDIGGGSTEFVLGPGRAGQHAEPPDSAAAGLAAVSVDIGCVRLTERHLRSDPPAPAEIEAAAADIDEALDGVAARIPVSNARTLVGLAGSVTTLAGIALGLPRYDAARIHHARISAASIHEQARGLLAQTRAQRAGIPVMHPGRVDVIAAGALIIDRIMARLGFGELLASEHDILDGIAWSIVAAGGAGGGADASRAPAPGGTG